MTEKSQKTGLERLLEPFAPNEINQLPKPYDKNSPKGKCPECKGFHGLPAVHLDYVGHAALTKRLLEADPKWTWEPLALAENGLPQLDNLGGLWIKLTVCGVTRLGYGDSQGKTGNNAIKEAIGDALRNAGMRFGAALDLWHKGDLYEAEVERGDGEGKKGQNTPPTPTKGVPKVSTPAEPETASEAVLKASYKAIFASQTLDQLREIWKANKAWIHQAFKIEGDQVTTLDEAITVAKERIGGAK